jgi:hypothetical protein
MLNLPAQTQEGIDWSVWDADFSTVTGSENTPATGTTFDSAADCHCRSTFTCEDTKSVYINLRYTDDNNRMYFVVGNNRQPLIRNVVGGSTQTAYVGAALTDGVSYQFDVVLEGQNYSLFKDNVLLSSGTFSTSGNETTTGGKVTHNLATNDIELSTHPYPSLGIATDRVICPQYGALDWGFGHATMLIRSA